MEGEEGTKTNTGNYYNFPSINWSWDFLRTLTSPLLMMSPPVSRTPHLWALSIIYILSFFPLQCVLDGCLSCYFLSRHPTGYPWLHCTWNSSTKLQKETPGTTDTLKWKSSDPCGKNIPGISNIDMYVPLSKNTHWGYFPYWWCIEKFPSLF